MSPKTMVPLVLFSDISSSFTALVFLIDSERSNPPPIPLHSTLSTKNGTGGPDIFFRELFFVEISSTSSAKRHGVSVPPIRFPSPFLLMSPSLKDHDSSLRGSPSSVTTYISASRKS